MSSVPDPSLAPFVVRPDVSLEDALARIEENRHRSVIVADERDVVVGTLSDGDARKAILDHRLLSIPVRQVMNTNFISLRLDRREEAGGIFEREHIFLIPLVDDEGRILEVLKAYD
ncbi:MAG TPA: CBS domain-containing protein [Gaiellaceae bacterium]|jgi:CBS domain-containing protein